MTKLRNKLIPLALASAFATPLWADSIPSVVVTVENSAPARGAFQTPFWIGMHDGAFDIYDRNVELGAEGLVPAPAVERLAEDGATGPISDEFSISQPDAPQTTMIGPTGPFAPGDRSSVTLNVDPFVDRYFSYASMVIPSNDAFVANGNPLAHPLFDENGRFVGSSFAVAGSEVLDAGTEVNDEIASNTAFLAQAAPDTGDTEGGLVVLHEGFRTDLSFPDGVLSQPVFGTANFLADNYRVATFSFRYIDLGQRRIRFDVQLDPSQEVTGSLVDSPASGFGRVVARDGERVRVRVRFQNLSGPAVAAHLHLGQAGTNGPVVANLTNSIQQGQVVQSVFASDIVGPLAESDEPLVALLNELAAGNIYVNIHTDAFPGGEIRGQVTL